MKKACLYVGPPGSGKSYLASIECEQEADIRHTTDFINLPECYLGLTNAQCMSQHSVVIFINSAKEHGIEVEKVKAFVGSKQTLLKNVSSRNDGRKVEGLIQLWCNSNYSPFEWELSVPLEVIMARDYS